MSKGYEMVIGLEVHVELSTESKLFCNCKTEFGAPPNTQCCPICMGMPGTLPVLNGLAVEYAVLAGIATNCAIARNSKQDRKNYFYPDLPKAYQISQFDLPLCEGGYLDIESEEGTKRIGITRIHIEEDAGKLIHHEENGTMIDCNRCGVPLIEIVSEPDIRSAEEAKAYVQKLRAILLYLGVSDCKMNEGSLRCDVNLSVRKKGETEFGTRTEMKNINSFQFIGKAIEYEFKRQVEAVEAGETIVQETRRFDQNDGKTHSMRRKEDSSDYRYFPDPDLPPIHLTQEEIGALKAKIPQLPDARKKVYMEEYGLSPYDSERLIMDKDMSDFFQQAATESRHPKLLANLIIGELVRLVPEGEAIPVSPRHMAQLADLFGSESINSGTAKKLVKELVAQDQDPEALVEQRGWGQINDEEKLRTWAKEALSEHPKSVADFQKGKEAAAKALIGQAMAKTGGKGNPRKLGALVMEELERSKEQ